MAHVCKRPVSSHGVYNRTFFSNVTRLLHDSWYFCVLAPPFISHFVRVGFIFLYQLSRLACSHFQKVVGIFFFIISRRRTFPLRRCSRPCCRYALHCVHVVHGGDLSAKCEAFPRIGHFELPVGNRRRVHKAGSSYAVHAVEISLPGPRIQNVRSNSGPAVIGMCSVYITPVLAGRKTRSRYALLGTTAGLARSQRQHLASASAAHLSWQLLRRLILDGDTSEDRRQRGWEKKLLSIACPPPSFFRLLVCFVRGKVRRCAVDFAVK